MMSSPVPPKFLENKEYPLDIIFIMAFSAIGAICVLFLPEGSILRIAFGIPLIVFIPGYALVSVLWPKKHNEVTNEDSTSDVREPKEITNIERVALSFGLSLAISSIICISLNFLWELSLIPIVLSMFAFIIITGGLGWYRRLQLPEEQRFYIPLCFDSMFSLNGTRTEKTLTVILTISLIIAGFSLAYLLTSVPEGEQFTQLYILDENGTVDNYPVNLTVNNTGTVLVGLASHEQTAIEYSMVVGIENANHTVYNTNWTDAFVLTNDTSYGRNITLDPGELFEEEFSFNIHTPGTHKVIWHIYLHEKEIEYDVYLWVIVI